MATKQELRTFRQIVDQVMGLMKYQSNDTVSRNKVKEDVQRAYLQEIMPYHQWPWLRNKINLQVQAYFGTGTASVTNNSTSVTLSETITDSRVGYSFSINGSNEIYKIVSHVGGTGTLVLDMPYTGNTSSTASFKIWAETVPMPAEANEIIEITQPNMAQPLTGVGLQELRRIAASAPKGEGRPIYYTLGDAIDPSPYSDIASLPATATRASSGLLKTIKFAATLGADTSTLKLQTGDRIKVSAAGSSSYNIEAIVASVSTTTVTNDTITYVGLSPKTESSTADTGILVQKLNTESYEKQKHLVIYPSIYNSKTILSVDYIKEIEPLVDDADEPSLPLADRIVLFWLGLSYSYSRERNPEESGYYRALADQRLARMAGNLNESKDKPLLTPSKLYLGSKRNAVRTRRIGSEGLNLGGGGSSTNPYGTPNQVAVFGTDGLLQSSSTISTTELGYLNGVTDNIQAQIDSLGLDNTAVGNRALISNGSIAIAESVVTSTELTYLDDVQALTEVTLLDNTVAANVATWDKSNFDSIHIQYSLKRDTARESGSIVISHDGTSAAIAQGGIASLGSNGVTLTVDISGSDVRLRYATTSTGSNATMKYKVQKWAS